MFMAVGPPYTKDTRQILNRAMCLTHNEVLLIGIVVVDNHHAFLSFIEYYLDLYDLRYNKNK